MPTWLTAWWRARVAGDALAELMESTMDVRGRALAESLGLEAEGPLTEEMGRAITTVLCKSA